MNRPTLPSRSLRRICVAITAGLALVGAFAATPALARPTAGAYLVFDARTGEVVAKHNADQAWYPASITKLMTTWVTLQAIRSGRIRPTSPVPMTAIASRQPPSKMGFKVGEIVTVDNALKIIMVKSANDVAWALGEAVGGSKEAFVGEMNRQAQLLGMRSTRWGNPNGLPDPSQITTARDLGILARALLTQFPEASYLWHLPGIQIGNEIVPNHNHLLDRFPGADGMKTGFICSSGFNVVASASRGNRRLVAVVLGSRNARQRAELAAELFTKGFEGDGGGLFGRFTTPEILDHMARGPEAGNPVRDMKPEICGKQRQNTPDVDDIGETTRLDTGRDSGAVIKPGEPGYAPVKPASFLTQRFDIGPPVRVWVGGADAAPGDAGDMLALAPGDTSAAPIFATTSVPAALLPAAAGAIRPRDPAAPGSGLSGAIRPADGGPMVIATPTARPQAAAQPAAKLAAKPAVTTAKPAAVAAKSPPPKSAAAATPTPKPAAAAKAPAPKATPAKKPTAPVPPAKPKKPAA